MRGNRFVISNRIVGVCRVSHRPRHVGPISLGRSAHYGLGLFVVAGAIAEKRIRVLLYG